MFDEIKVPRNCRAVVNGQLVTQTRFRVGRRDSIYFVDTSPFVTTIPAQARSREGIEHAVVLTARFWLDTRSIAQMLEGQGYSDRTDTVRVSAGDRVQYQSVVAVVAAVASNYIHEKGFFDLGNAAQVTQELRGRIQTACASAYLSVELEHCDIKYTMPAEDLLAEIAATPGLNQLANYFRERLRQKELLAAELEEARAEAQKRSEVAKANVKITILDEQDRVKAHQAQLDELEAQRKEAAQKRNSKIQEAAAQLEHIYKMERLKEEMQLAGEHQKLAAAKAAEEAEIRNARKQDQELEIVGEEKRSSIRIAERAALANELGKLIDTCSSLPRPDFSQVHTLVTAGTGSSADPTSAIANRLVSLLANAVDLPTPDGTKKLAGIEV